MNSSLPANMTAADRVDRTAYDNESPLAFVHLGYGLDAVQYRDRFLAGDEPDETPYGFHIARQLGYRVEFSHDHTEGQATRFFRRAAKRLLGFDVLHLWRNRRAIERADVVWTMQESEWLALRFCGLFSTRLRKPLVGNTVWLFDRWEQINPLLRRLYARLARGLGVLTVHSDRYVPIMRKVLPGARVERMFFGTSTETHPMLPPVYVTDRTERPIRVLAAGNDPTRDWNTLLAAVGNDPRFDIELVCSWVTPAQRAHHASVRPRAAMTSHRIDTFQALYRWADIVVVPMRENRFSGITVALEATANGKPVVASRTGGVPTYFGEDAVRYVPPGDPAALRDALAMPAGDAYRYAVAAQAMFCENDYSLVGLMRRYATLSGQVAPGQSFSTRQA